jgi:hypothetical protein
MLSIPLIRLPANEEAASKSSAHQLHGIGRLAHRHPAATRSPPLDDDRAGLIIARNDTVFHFTTNRNEGVLGGLGMNAPTLEMNAPTLEMNAPTLEMNAPTLEMNAPRLRPGASHAGCSECRIRTATVPATIRFLATRGKNAGTCNERSAGHHRDVVWAM